MYQILLRQEILLIKKTVSIIGGGTSGISAALQCEVERHDYILIEKTYLGGMIKYANAVNNVPFIDKGISGNEIIELLKKRMEKSEKHIIYNEVIDVKYKENNFFTFLLSGEIIISKYLIWAAGSIPLKPDFAIPVECENRIFYYPEIDVDNMKSKVIIYGGGDIAFDYALTLKGTIKNISIYCRNKVKANKSLIEKVEENGIKYNELSEISEIFLNEDLINVLFKNGITVETDYLIIAIGRKPNNELIDSIIDKKNLFIIGDANNNCRQLVCAASEGIKTVMKISQRENDGC